MPSGVFKLQSWYRMLPLAALAFLLGCWGALRMSCFDFGHSGSCFTPRQLGAAIISSINLIKPDPKNLSVDRPWQTVIATLLYYALAFGAAFRVAVDSVRRDMRVVWAQRKRNHVIVCGLGQTGMQVVQSFLNAGHEVVVITLDPNSPAALASEKRDVPVLGGDAALPSLLKLAGLDRAHALIITSGSDAKNVEIGMRARDTLSARKPSSPLKVLAQVRAEWLYDAISSHQGAVLGSEAAEFRIFNLHASTAREMLGSPAFRSAVGLSQSNPNLIIAGFGVMGAEVLVQAVLGTFALPGHRVSAAILDRRGDAAAAMAAMKCSHLGEIADLKFVPATFSLDSDKARSSIDALLREGVAPHAVIVALGDDDDALHTALDMRHSLDANGKADVPVFLRLKDSNKLGAFFAAMEDRQTRKPRLIPFGDLAGVTTPEALLDERGDVLARAVHEIFLAAHGTDLTADEPWTRLPEHFKQQNREFADHIGTKLAAIGYQVGPSTGTKIVFSQDEVEALARMEHWRWSLSLRAHGWRYAETRDNTARKHPLLVDWGALPEDAKEINRKMVREIPNILAHANLGVTRNAN